LVEFEKDLLVNESNMQSEYDKNMHDTGSSPISSLTI